MLLGKHQVRQHTKRPDVDTFVMGITFLKQLRGHVFWCAYHELHSCRVCAIESCETKICELSTNFLSFRVGFKHDVFKFDVTVADALFVQMANCL